MCECGTCAVQGESFWTFGQLLGHLVCTCASVGRAVQEEPREPFWMSGQLQDHLMCASVGHLEFRGNIRTGVSQGVLHLQFT